MALMTETFPEVEALSGTTKKLMVLIHGLGSDGDDLIGLVPFMQHALPDYAFISPHGVEPFDMAPFGRQWFSLSDREQAKIIALVSQNAPLLAEIIQEKQRQFGLDNSDTVLLGFSQGTMIGLYLNLIQEQPFAGVIGFSGKLLAPAKCINTQTPICLIHGTEDGVVDVSELSKAEAYLRANNIRHTSLKIPNLTHSIDHQGMDFAIKFLQDNVL